MPVTILLLLWLFPLGAVAQEAPPTYKGSLRLPLELQTRQGQPVPRGKVDLEVRLEQKTWLLFSQGEQALARVEGKVLEGDAQDLPGAVPLLGTVFLQSSAVPLRSDFDRRYSKTGKPQYREESYDWRGTLRVHRPLNPRSREVYFIFHERGQDERHRRIQFTLLRTGSGE
ncbi:MAG: hypothetical protein OXU26_07125 [Acidobacteriota bacterium]|nr:hypothetical protein [Acidobacteriota bacterium]